MKNRRLLIILSLFAFLFLIAAILVYFIFFGRPTLKNPGQLPGGDDRNIQIPRQPEEDLRDPLEVGRQDYRSKFNQIYSKPQSGSTFGYIKKDNGGIDHFVRIMDRATGNLYTFKDVTLAQTTDTLIPHVYETIWSTGNDFVARYLAEDNQTIKSYQGTLIKGSAEGVEIDGDFLPDNISHITTSPTDSDFILLIRGKTKTTIAKFETIAKKLTTLGITEFNDWIGQGISATTTYLTTKASGSAQGYLFEFRPSNQSYRKILGEVYGLTTLASPSGDQILYSQTEGGGPRLKSYGTKTGAGRTFTLRTLPEKCVWSTVVPTTAYCAVPETVTGSQPDLWYQGVSQWKDSLYKIDVESGQVSETYNLSFGANTDFDGIKLQLNEAENELLITNRNDMTLWLLSL